VKVNQHLFDVYLDDFSCLNRHLLELQTLSAAACTKVSVTGAPEVNTFVKEKEVPHWALANVVPKSYSRLLSEPY
jgi:hypothetical protein